MLAQRSLGASVCLRCRLSQALLRLGRAPALPLAATTAAAASASASVASFTSYTRRLQDKGPFDIPDVAPPDIQREFGDTNPFASQVRRLESSAPRTAPTERKPRIKPFRRGRRGKKLKEWSAPLKRQYLGEDSEVLILRDVIEPPNDTRDGAEDAPVEDDAAAAKRREIRQKLEESIVGQSSAPGQEEVNEQINKLRPVSAEGPQYPAFVTRKELADIRKALKDGYNVGQLRRYAAVTESIEKLEELNLEEKPERGFKWKSAWQEGMTPIEKRIPEPETTAIPVEKLPKMKVVERILRSIWDVGVIEENEAIGEIEVEIEPWQLDLLLDANARNANYTILDNIGNQRRVRIETYRPKNILRFIAERENTEQAITDLERALRRFRTLDFNLGDFESLRQKRGNQQLMDFFSKRDMEVAARLSGTILEIPSDSKVVIHGTDQTTVELARRILFSIIDPPSGAETRILADTEEEGFLQISATESALHHRYRRKNYGRWTFPVMRDTVQSEAKRKTNEETEEISDERTETGEKQATVENTVAVSAEARPDTPPENVQPGTRGAEKQSALTEEIVTYLKSSVDGPSGPPEGSYPEDKNARTTYWSPHSLVELYASYGNIIHEPPPANNSLTPISLPALLEQSHNPSRTFLHAIPGFSPFLQHVAAKAKFQRHINDEKWPDALLFRFSPAPWDLEDPSSPEDFPDLGLRLQVGQNAGRARFQGLGITIRERNVDVLLPRKAVDVRFIRREVLWTRDALMRSEEVRNYLAMINMNLGGGGAIRAPATLRLRIPAWTVRNADKYSSLPTQETEHGKEFFKEFIFSAVEHRQMVRFDLPDDKHRVSYTSVEAGRLGGRRGELRLRLRKPAKSSSELHAQVPGLVEKAFNMASLIDDAVHDRLPGSEVNIKKVARHASFKRMMSDGRLEEPLTYNTTKEVEDEDVESGDKVEKEADSGGERKQATGEGDEAVSQAGNSEAPLKEGAN